MSERIEQARERDPELFETIKKDFAPPEGQETLTDEQAAEATLNILELRETLGREHEEHNDKGENDD